MGNFRKNIFEELFQTNKFELEKKHQQELSDLFELHIRNKSVVSLSYRNARSKLRENHFQENLKKFIELLITAFQKDSSISDNDLNLLEGKLQNYSESLCEYEKNDIQQFLISQGIQIPNAIISKSKEALEKRLKSIVFNSKSLLSIAVIQHNENATKINTEKLPSKIENKTDRWISKAKDHPILSIIIILGLLIGPLVSMTDIFVNMDNIFTSKQNNTISMDDSLTALIKVNNKMMNRFEISSYCEYEIMESDISRINRLSKGRLHLFPKNEIDNDPFKINPNETKNFEISFPNPKLYSSILDRGSANLYLVINLNSNKNFVLCSAPFDRISLKKYFIECVIDSAELSYYHK